MLILKLLAGLAIGALAGYAWYRLVGCSTGTCPLTSRWWMTTGYGGLMGLLFAASK